MSPAPRVFPIRIAQCTPERRHCLQALTCAHADLAHTDPRAPVFDGTVALVERTCWLYLDKRFRK